MSDDPLSDQKRLALAQALAAASPATMNPMLQRQGAAVRESRFQSGVQASPWFSEFQQKHGESPDLNDPSYNYRAAWAQGVRPQPYAPDGGAYHRPSVAPNGQPLKAQNHPTMWMEQFMRQTGKDPLTIGVTTPEAAQQFMLGAPK